MGIFGFLFGTLIGKIASAIVGIVVLAIAFVVVVMVLAATGGPGACSPGGGVITVDGANAARFQEKWDAFDAILDRGSPSSVSFNESAPGSPRADRRSAGSTAAPPRQCRLP